jgi:flagellar basal-body rod modification protein FlgD
MTVSAPASNPATSGTTNNSNSSNSSSSSSSTSTPGIADNFQTFLTLLTTQLQNQNPLDPLDTNQFTAQLVQFAGVEQQLKQNDQLASLISIEKSTQSTQALTYVGYTVAVDGSTTQFNGSATWNVVAPQNTNATLTVTNAAGQTCYTGNFTLSNGNGTFVWDGKGNDGTQWPAGTYTLTATGQDQSGNTVGITTEVQGVVQSVDLTSSPPLLSIGGQSYTTDQVKRVVLPSASSSSSSSGSSSS